MKSGLVLRARIIVLAADGVAHAEIARRFAISRQTVINWRARYQAHGLAGLHDEDRSGRPRTLDRDKLITTRLTPPPRRYGVTHWSSRLLTETFKFSTDPQLAGKVTDIVGLYMNPPENAIVNRAGESGDLRTCRCDSIVLCVDENQSLSDSTWADHACRGRHRVS